MTLLRTVRPSSLFKPNASLFIISCKMDFTGYKVQLYRRCPSSHQSSYCFFPSFCSKWNSNNFRLCLMIRIFSTLLLVWFKANEIALSSVSSGVGGKKYFIFNCKNLLLHDITSKIVQDVISKETMGLYRDDGLIVLNKVNSQKITHMWGRHLLMNLKNKYLLKSCWSGLIKIKITFL